MEIFKPLIGISPFLFSSFVALAVVLTFKKWRRRASRRSPFAGKQLGHVPGQQLLDRMQSHEISLDYGLHLMLLSLPMAFLAWTGMRIDWSQIRPGFLEWFCCWV